MFSLLISYRHWCFFSLGFFADLLLLERVDSLYSLGQQVLYLLILGVFLTEPRGLLKWTPVWSYKYGNDVFHFCLGALLSLYSIFFWQSAPNRWGLVFPIMVVTLLFLNETQWLKKRSYVIKSSLFTLCLYCFFIVIVPILTGYVGLWPMLFSTFITVSFLSSLWALRRYFLGKIEVLKLLPSYGVVALVFLLYFLHILPPLPLAVKEISVHHNVERIPGEVLYKAKSYRKKWHIWRRDSRPFLWQDGEKVYVFASIFSPTSYSGEISMRWFLQSEIDRKWQQTDEIPIRIQGGRTEGYRVLSFKRHIQKGRWKVQVISQNNRLLGEIAFKVEPWSEDRPRVEQLDFL